MRAAAILMLVLLLAACDGYPSDWSGIARAGLIGIGCPDLTGTWQLHPSRGGRPYTQSLIDQRVRNRERQRWHWETVTIAGRTRDSLALTLRRHPRSIAAYHDTMELRGDRTERDYRSQQAPQVRWRGGFVRMTDSAYAENLAKLTLPAEERIVLRHGSDYACDGGWLVGDRTVHDPGPDRSRPRPDTVIGAVRLARSRDGHLVFDARYDEATELTVWCGDGCRGIPLGTWETDEWSRLAPVEPPPPLLLERPWAEPFAPPPLVRVDPGFAPLQSAAEVRETLAPFIPAAVRLLDVTRDGSQYRAALALDGGPDALRPMFEPLARSQSFPTTEVIGATRDGGGAWTVALRLGVVTARTSTSPREVDASLRALLPAGTSLSNLRPSGAWFHVDLDFPSQAAFIATVRAIGASTAFEVPDVMQAERAGQRVRVSLRLRERMTP